MPILRNIKLVYIVTALQYSWFWIAIWVLYYLRFTNYAGIGLLETIMVTTSVFGEVPTGALADILGKKRTLTLAFIFGGLGNVLMGLSGSFNLLSISVIAATIGHVLTSGTLEALVFDSLKTSRLESEYQRVLGNISSIKMLSLALSSIVGGFAYGMHPSLPFFMVGATQIVAVLITLFLIEPPIDTEVFDWQAYKTQTVAGFFELFKSSKARVQNVLIIAMSMIVLMNAQMLIDVQLVAQGWNEQHLGLIITGMFILSAIFSQCTKYLTQKLSAFVIASWAALCIGLTMIGIPFVGIIVGTLVIAVRNGTLEIFNNSVSESLNNNTSSQYRATTLSTYSMLANLPYIIGATLIGALMDSYSVHTIVAFLAVPLLAVALLALSRSYISKI